jgi:hypothetical protein
MTSFLAKSSHRFFLKFSYIGTGFRYLNKIILLLNVITDPLNVFSILYVNTGSKSYLYLNIFSLRQKVELLAKLILT